VSGQRNDFAFIEGTTPRPLIRGEWESDPEGSKTLIGQAITTSGRVLKFNAVLLFDLREIAVAEQISAAAQRNLAGFNSGIGFIGNFSYVVGAMLIRSAVESTISNSMAVNGMNQLEHHYQHCRRVRASGKFIPLNFITNIRVPAPGTWRCVQFTDQQAIHSGYLHNGDPAVVLQLVGGETSTVLWDKIEQWDVI
jgi:hypothetical protein